MKVKELIVALKKKDQEAEIIMAKDPEGNGFSPLDCILDCVYLSESTYDGEMYDISWSAYDAGMEPNEWKEFKKSNKISILMEPIN